MVDAPLERRWETACRTSSVEPRLALKRRGEVIGAWLPRILSTTTRYPLAASASAALRTTTSFESPPSPGTRRHVGLSVSLGGGEGVTTTSRESRPKIDRPAE